MGAKKKNKSTAARAIRRATTAVVSNPAWEAIYQAVEKIPAGSVATYGGVAQLAGLPRRARLVGTALKSLPASRRVPWHRVIAAGGRLAFPDNSDAFAKQRNRLAREGVPMLRKRIDLTRYGWPRETKTLDELLWGGK